MRTHYHIFTLFISTQLQTHNLAFYVSNLALYLFHLAFSVFYLAFKTLGLINLINSVGKSTGVWGTPITKCNKGSPRL